MINIVSSMYFLLAQNKFEKTLTTVGIALFVGFMFFLIIDSMVKQKYVPKDKHVRGFLIFLMILSIIAFFVYVIFIK